MTNFPKEINALIATYLKDKEGDYFRDQTGDFIIKEVRDRKTYTNGVYYEYKIDVYNNQFWYKNGELHRDYDKPAVINFGGTQKWYKNGKLHRDNDMPAVIFYTGTQIWYKNGKEHRDNDMPAVIDSYGKYKKWYKNGKKYNPVKYRYNKHVIVYSNRTRKQY
jgi:hypothetical protein